MSTHIKEEELLKKLRGHMAFKKGVEPYKIFRDVELELLLKERPKTIEQLASISGFPATGKRVESCGQAIIAIFNMSDRIVDFEIEGTSEDFTVFTKLKPMKLF